MRKERRAPPQQRRMVATKSILEFDYEQNYVVGFDDEAASKGPAGQQMEDGVGRRCWKQSLLGPQL